MSDAAFVGGPDKFVHLELEADGEGVGDDAFDEFFARDWMEPRGNRLEDGRALVFLQRRNPGKEYRAAGGQVVLGELLFGPLVVLGGSDDEFDFVGGFEVGNILEAIPRDLAAGRALEIHDAADARVDRRDVEGAAGFDQNSVAEVAKLPHQIERAFLEERLPAGKFDERFVFPIRRRKLRDACVDCGELRFCSLCKSISGVAVRTAKVARRQPHKNAGQPRKGAFALQAEIDFVDDERVGHREQRRL